MARDSGRPVEVGTWSVPAQVSLEPGRILYRLGNGTGRWKHTSVRRELLDRFGALAAAPENAIGTFAREWGVLGLCEHDQAPDHYAAGRLGPCLPRIAQRGPLRRKGNAVVSPDLTLWEPIELWRSLASKAAALIRLAVVLSDEAPGSRSPTDWGVLGGRPTPRPVDRKDREKEMVEVERVELGAQVSAWLRLASVRPIVTWGDDPLPRLLLTTAQPWAPLGSLLGALAIQLAAAVVGKGGFAVCSECGGFYRPTRAPKRGQRAFCPGCRGDGAPQRSAQRDYQSRKQRGVSNSVSNRALKVHRC